MQVPIIWLVILAVLLIIEIATLGLTTIWFAGGALVAFLVSLVGGPLWLQITLFIVVSFILLVFTRPAAARLLNKKVEKTNVESLPGQKAVVLQEINNIQGTGQVRMNGLEWTARSQSGKIIPKDAIVNVVTVEGVKLIVEEEN